MPRSETAAERAHAMFVLLGLRHLCVVDENSHVRGIITRRDLDRAAGRGAWRRNKMAPAPDPVSPSGKLRHNCISAVSCVGHAGGPSCYDDDLVDAWLCLLAKDNRGCRKLCAVGIDRGVWSCAVRS